MFKNTIFALCFLPNTGFADGITLELNGVETRDDACRMVFTAQSTSGVEGLIVETAIFTTSGAVLMLTLFDFVDLPAGSLRVRQFDVAGQTCADVSRVLFNGVDSCEGADCATALSVGSKVDTVEVLG
jgi:hypothetical protein